MLKSLRLKNFKSWQDTGKIEFAPITAFYGANSSGKSSIIQSLLLLKQTEESTDKDLPLFYGDDTSNAYVNLGSFLETIHTGNKNLALTFDLEWTSNEPINIIDPEGKKSARLLSTNDFRFHTTIKEVKSGKEVVDNFTYQLSETKYTLQRTEKNEYKIGAERAPYPLKRFKGRAWDLPKPNNYYGFPKQAMSYYRNADFLQDLGLSLENLLHSIKYLGPLRTKPQRTYAWSGTKPEDVGVNGERTIDALAYAVAENLKRNHKHRSPRLRFDAFIASWLKKLGLIHDFKLISPEGRVYKLKIKKSPYSSEVSLPDVGVGVSQVLPVITLLNFVPEGSVVLIEQPEIHLHPSVQSLLGDLFIEATKQRKIQIIFESHSEHLLRRLQRRVADGTLQNEELKVYFCNTANNQGISKIEALNVDLFGNITNWPQDFFGNELEEFAEMQKAAILRKMKG